MKKRILVFSLLALCLSLCIGGTLAYFTANGTARNVITAGNIKIDLIETDAEGNPFENVSGVTPGAEVDKVVTVKNTGDNPCYVRISVDKEIQLAEGKSGEVDLSLIDIDFDTENWTLQDGFYYYNVVLEPNETTEPLFTTVTFNTDMDNLYAGCSANVMVCAQAVQCANNGGSVFEANGWPSK